MPFKRNMEFAISIALLSVPAATLLLGLALYHSPYRGLAPWCWSLGAAPAAFSLAYQSGEALFRRKMGVDVLALFSIVGAVALHEALTANVIAIMYAGGRVLESYAAGRASREMSALLQKAPRHAYRYEGEQLAQVPLDAVRQGDRLVVRTGDIVPVDGMLVDDLATLDESTLTGESAYVDHRRGARLSSGTLNMGPPFNLLASATAHESTFAGIVRLVEAAQRAKAPSARLADRYAGWFVPFAGVLAIGAWGVTADPLRALAVLVVATPCPLLLAVPIALVSGLSSCARRGIIVKGGAVLEQLAAAHTVCLDKTGTLTSGQAKLIGIECAEGFDQQDILRTAASLDQMSSHPMAASIVQTATERGIPLSIPTGSAEQHGAGLTGLLDGRPVAIGTFAFVSARATMPDWAMRHAARTGQEGTSAVYLAVDGRFAGVLEFADQIRLETPRALRLLRRQGVRRIVMLTGDHEDIARAVGAALGLDEVFAELTPSAKLHAVRALCNNATTIMVGDGVNDTPALAVADVGIAMGARGAAAAAERADAVLLVDRLDRIAEAIQLAKRAKTVALQSVVAGMGLSAVAMLVAALGYLPPLTGAILQEAIDAAVILNALRALAMPGQLYRRRTLPEDLSTQLTADHQRLAAVLDQLSALAMRLGSLPVDQAIQALHALNTLLEEKLITHEQADETTLYPALANLLGGDDPMSTMSRSHREIFLQHRKLKTLIDELDRHPAEAQDLIPIQRLLLGLDAILRLHFAQEDELYHTLH